MSEFDDLFDQHEDELPMVGRGCASDDEPGVYWYDESGALDSVEDDPGDHPTRGRRADGLPGRIPFRWACSQRTLNGSWLLEFEPHFGLLFGELRGPMRLEAAGGILRASGDIYFKRRFNRVFPTIPVRASPVAGPQPLQPALPARFQIRRNWYPAFPQAEYRWYFRSTGVRYHRGSSVGTLRINLKRHLWSQASQEFVSEDSGSLHFECSRSLIVRWHGRRSTVRMHGTARIGGQVFEVTATKTSPYYRGCLVEVDVMQNRNWPATAQDCTGTSTFSFSSVYRADGLDFHVRVNDTGIPQDNNLSNAELHGLLAAQADLRPTDDSWYLWLLVGSRLGTGGTLGIMFDTNNPPHREGAVGFADPTLPNLNIILSSARNQALNNVPAAFLRTLIHEAGHAFNLFHPKHDVHSPAIGTTIMNQTSDVVGFATAANPYPCNATFDFNEHNRTSLIHSPDPQVKPGWKEFGWGHGSASSGLPEPADVAGLEQDGNVDPDVHLSLDAPASVRVGEVLLVTATLTNRGQNTRFVSPALNLSETDLRLTLRRPDGAEQELRDIVYACADGRLVELEPEEFISGTFQLTYTNRGHCFDRPGSYLVHAVMELGQGTVAIADSITVDVAAAESKDERDLAELMLDEGVGLSLALGDIREDSDAEARLAQCAETYSDSLTGATAALILANSYERTYRNLRTDTVARKANKSRASEALDRAAKAIDTLDLARLAVAVVSPTDTDAPLLKTVKTALKGKGKSGAQKVLADHLK